MHVGFPTCYIPSICDASEDISDGGDVGVGFEVGAETVPRFSAVFEVGEDELEGLPDAGEKLEDFLRSVDVAATVDRVVAAVYNVAAYQLPAAERQ